MFQLGYPFGLYVGERRPIVNCITREEDVRLFVNEKFGMLIT